MVGTVRLPFLEILCYSFAIANENTYKIAGRAEL